MGPDPGHVDAFAGRLTGIVQAFPGWSPEDLRGDRRAGAARDRRADFVRIERAAEVLGLIPDAQLAVVPGTRHTELTARTEVLAPILARFLAGRPRSWNGSVPGTSQTLPMRP